MLVTDAGFEDLVEIGRQDRPSLYDVSVTRPESLVPAELRIGVGARGEIPTDEALADIAASVADLAPESVAISTLFSFADAAREVALEQAISAATTASISRSSLVAPEFREFERTSTTITNAYLVPLVADYLRRLGEGVLGAGVTGEVGVMRSSGGLIDLAGAAALPASIVLSGPAGGVVAAAALGEALGPRELEVPVGVS